MKSGSQKGYLVALFLSWVLVLSLAVGATQVLSEQAREAEQQRYSLSRSVSSASADDVTVDAAIRGVFSLHAAPALGLTMADFTGDTHPDIATVELERADSASAHYWIEIRLTEGGVQTLSVTAPSGGLFIKPKDVTGDGNLDLVVRSASTRGLVAVFLNDGTGHFRRAETAGLSEATADGPYRFAFTERAVYAGVALGSPESNLMARPRALLLPLPRQNGFASPWNQGVIKSRLFLSSRNRASPASV